ncbi:winged helix-turn-helix domain-containing protein [Spongisporangium articulatum]|uniref:Winged helix-turn-helix domain-containing protein n=1 Tax=Spongisporangium articulatum TaxID=3362603 RepID=A0ABW8AS15_9ACTN
MPETEPAHPAHPALGFEEVVHQRARLAVLAVLAEAGEADFGFLKSTLGLTDGNLGRHLAVLAEAGLVRQRKDTEGRRPRTWVTITGQGRSALAAELAGMRALLARLDPHGG